MVKAIAVTMSLAVASGAAHQGVAPRAVTLQDLTVPAERLPAGCGLVTAPSRRIGENTVVSGRWAGLPITTNNWAGTDPYVIATIRSRMEPPPAEPDGPPLHRRAASSYFLQLADGIEEAYAAIYAQDEQNLIVVHATKLDVTSDNADRPGKTRAFTTSTSARVEIGPIRAMVSGSRSECFDAVAAYVTALSAVR